MTTARASQPDPAKEALKALARALARAAAIEDYRRQNPDQWGESEGGDLHALQRRGKAD